MYHEQSSDSGAQESSNWSEDSNSENPQEKVIQASPMLNMFLQTLEPHQYFEENSEVMDDVSDPVDDEQDVAESPTTSKKDCNETAER